MKKLLLLIPALFCFTSIIAQDFSVGPKVGVSQGNVSVNGEGFSSGDSKLGYHLGVFVRMGGSSIFVQPEFLFTQTGGQIIENTPGGDDVLDVNFNRFDIPMMFGFKLAKFFRIQAGPVASILLDYKLEDAIQNAVELDYRSSSLGYQAGIGLDIGNLILDLKYENSLSKISKSVIGFQTDQRQNQLILSAGFRLF
jgi:hypothetical protein